MDRLPPDSPPTGRASAALAVLTGGDESAAAQLMSVVYDELRAIAGRFFRGQPGAHTLQPTALVHEAFLRVAERTGADFEDRAHFSAVCAVAMRGILANHAEARGAQKRGGGWRRVSLTELGTPQGDPIDALALDEALTALTRRSERQACIVEYRFFGGMTMDEIAHVVGVSRSTVEEDWRMARAWLKLQLRKGDAP